MNLLRRTSGLVLCLLFMLRLATGQVAAQKPESSPPNSPGNGSQGAPPMVTLKSASRMVTVEVVVRDRQGHPVSGLSAKDFQVFEQIPPKRDQNPETISTFEAVTLEGIRAASKGLPQLPPGIYSNLVDMQKMAAPPTVLLIDGLNTSTSAQLQVRRQMLKMLNSLPQDVPAAVFLMDRNLHFLQGFTTDPRLLKAALGKALSLDTGLQVADPRDNSTSVSSLAEDALQAPANAVPPSVGLGNASADHTVSIAPNTLADMKNFEREVFSASMDMRVRLTLDALSGIARYLSGYPGRKNLLWVSSSFPIAIAPDPDYKFIGTRGYEGQMRDVARALSGASVAVYPMDPLGVSTSSSFDASARVFHPSDGRRFGQSVMREAASWDLAQESMRSLAEETGGRVCVNNNDLANCVQTAVNDGLSYYQLAYYPDKGDWRGEFHRVAVKTALAGVHLAYREGYYARPSGTEPADDKDELARSEAELQNAACGDLLGATSILVMAQALPPESPGQARFFLVIDPNTIAFPSSQAGDRGLLLTFAFCTFDGAGKPLQYSHQNLNQKLTSQEYAALLARHGITHPVAFHPDPIPARVRLLVRDRASGHMGGVDLPYAVPAPTPATGDTSKSASPEQH